MQVKRSGSDLNDGSDEDDSGDNRDWSGLDETPSKRPKTNGATSGQKNGTPTRLAATRAGATIAEASTQLLQSSESSHDELETPRSATARPTPPAAVAAPASTVQPHSIFGNVPPKSTYRGAANDGAVSLQSTAFSGTGMDAYFGSEPAEAGHSLYAPDLHSMYYMDHNDGEI